MRIRFPFIPMWKFVEIQAEKEIVQSALADETVEHESTRAARDHAFAQLETERARRIGAEALATARQSEIDRLVAQCAALQAQIGERVKSLDSLVVKLSEPRAPEPAPDLDQYRKASEDVVMQGLRGIRKVHAALDQQLIQKLYPSLVRHPLNEPAEGKEA